MRRKGDTEMQNDPVKNYYCCGYEDAKNGKKNRRGVPRNFKLAYVSGRHDFHSGKPSRYEVAQA